MMQFFSWFICFLRHKINIAQIIIYWWLAIKFSFRFVFRTIKVLLNRLFCFNNWLACDFYLVFYWLECFPYLNLYFFQCLYTNFCTFLSLSDFLIKSLISFFQKNRLILVKFVKFILILYDILLNYLYFLS